MQLVERDDAVVDRTGELNDDERVLHMQHDVRLREPMQPIYVDAELIVMPKLSVPERGHGLCLLAAVSDDQQHADHAGPVDGIAVNGQPVDSCAKYNRTNNVVADDFSPDDTGADDTGADDTGPDNSRTEHARPFIVCTVVVGAYDWYTDDTDPNYLCS